MVGVVATEIQQITWSVSGDERIFPISGIPFCPLLLARLAAAQREQGEVGQAQIQCAGNDCSCIAALSWEVIRGVDKGQLAIFLLSGNCLLPGV
jgi:hypothetical protein